MKTVYLFLFALLFSTLNISAQEKCKKGSKIVKTPDGEKSCINTALNLFSAHIESASSIEQLQGDAINFPLGTGFGGDILFQHIFSGSDFAIYLQTGFMQWKSSGTMIYLQDTLFRDQIKDKLMAIPVQIGLKYYKRCSYLFLEGGVYLTKIKKTTTYNGNDNAFYKANNGVISKTVFSFSPGIGYEIKINKKSSIDFNLRYQRMIYNDPSLNLIGFRIGYDLLL